MNFLHIALDLKKTDVAKFLIKICDKKFLKQEFLSSSKSKKTALHQITELRDTDLAKQALSKIGNKKDRVIAIETTTLVEIKGERPRTLNCFHLAALIGCKGLVTLYLNEGIDVDHLTAENDTALLLAAKGGHNTTVQYLLSINADPSIENAEKSTALYLAVRYEKERTVDILLSKANPNQGRLLGLVQPIVLASALGNKEIVKSLIHKGADVKIKIPGGTTPLHHDAKEGHTRVIKLLLKHFAEIDDTDDNGDTPLIFATMNGYCPAVNLLISGGGDVNYENHAGHNAWFYAINNDRDEILEELVHSLFEFASKKKKSISVGTSLFLAASLGKCQKIETLFKLSVDPSITDKEGNTFMHYAAMHDHENIIEMFQEKVSIDCQNKTGNSPLHLACLNGFENTVRTLLKHKAKTNIYNDRGENALHVAAYSRSTTPEMAKSLVKHTIEMHAWDCVNAFDKEGNNALHKAAKFAKPDVLWEFRFVRFKDPDVDGNLPLHESVRPDDPEALDTMLDIYECMQRDADINAVSYKKKESVLHMAASEGFHYCVARLIFYGADLSLGDCNGNTVLHRLVKESVLEEHTKKQHMSVFNTVIKESVRWWCQKHAFSYPNRSIDLFRQYQREAILYLINGVTNKEKMSVLAYATKLGAHQILSRLLMLDNVTKFKTPDSTMFDITYLTPMTKGVLSGSRKIGLKCLSLSSIEYLLTLKDRSRASRVLDIPPMKKLEHMYTRTRTCVYGIMMVLHIVYMLIFTYTGVELSVKMRETNGTVPLSEPEFILMYIIVPIEPLVWIIYVLRMYCCKISTKDEVINRSGVFLTLWTLFSNFVFHCFTVAWIILMLTRYKYQDYILAISLCIGWLLTIAFTRGFKHIQYFWCMLQSLIIKDIFRFVVVYVFVLLAFSFSLHVIFQVSSTITETYATPADTLFLMYSLMLGAGKLFDDDFKQGMTSAGRSLVVAKLFYILYNLVATVVLLDLLIAMVNESYSDHLNKEAMPWRIDSVDIGIDIEKFFSFAPKAFGRLKIEQRHEGPTIGKRWFLILEADHGATLKSTRRER